MPLSSHTRFGAHRYFWRGPRRLGCPGLPAPDEESEHKANNRAHGSADGRERHRVPLDGIDHRVVQKVRAGVDGEHLPLPVLLDGSGGPAAVEVETSAVGEFITFFSGATRDREG